MMKNFAQLMATTAAAMMLFSCSSDDNTVPGGNSGDGSTLKATMGQLTPDGDIFPSAPSTRTTLGASKEIKWVEGDSINVFDGTQNRRFNVTTVSAEGTSCTFAGTPLGDGNAATRYVALYPYSMKSTYSGSTISGVTLPYVQKAVTDGFDPACNLMTASADVGSNLEFNHVCSYIKVKTDFDCSGLTLTAEGQKLAGDFDIAVGTDGTPTVQNITDASDHVKLVGDIKAGTWYYIAVLPGTYSQGIKVQLEAATYKDAIEWTNSRAPLTSYSLSSSNALTTAQAKIKSLGEMKKNALGRATKYIDFVYMNDGTADINATHGTRILWAKYNLGAESETEDGDFYAWGETKPKDSCSKDNYLCNNYYPPVLDEAHDAATANLGYGWHMPTAADIVYLKEHNIFVYTAGYNGKEGFIVYPGKGDVKDYQKMGDGTVYRYENGCTPKKETVSDEAVVSYINGLSTTAGSDMTHLFFVFAGGKNGTTVSYNAVRYWTNSRGNNPLISLNDKSSLTAYYWGLDKAAFNIWSYFCPRYTGLSIRPVLEVKW